VVPETTSRPAYYPFLGPLLLMTKLSKFYSSDWLGDGACMPQLYVRQVWSSHPDSGRRDPRHRAKAFNTNRLKRTGFRQQSTSYYGCTETG
jgi:hypothetical protein